MNKERLYLASPHMSKENYEQKYVQEAFDTNWIAPLGENVDMFEKEFANKVHINSGVALASGTSAIHMALKAAGVGKNDIVLCSSLTFSASANPIIYQEAIPVFIGSNKETWNMDPEALEDALKKYPTAKAVIVVHLYGLSAELEPIIALCEKYNVTLIEDAAESLGTYYKGKQTGTFGEYGVYSFNGNKIITTSGGGMLVSDNNEMIQKVRFWATQSRDNAVHYEHSELGYNYRMSNILAGIGRGQLKVLDERVKKKRMIYNYYKENLSDIVQIGWMPDNDWCFSNYWLSCIVLKELVLPIELINALKAENIESRPLWKPMHLQPYFSNYDFIGNDFSEKIFYKGICLPSDTKSSVEQLDRVIKITRELFV